MKSLALDRSAWDLVLDASGNIAVVTEPYAVAQDVACACRLFNNELWYDKNKGIPYDSEIVGHRPPVNLLIRHMESAARAVPLVAEAKVVISGDASRKVAGSIEITDVNNVKSRVTF
ncbi:MAG: hypothetical protein LBK01_06900 [Burkholderiaceae bacterium]|jgi:hypothetical protein|nr:hypothetical protein [Burkholderiaceae bacterium]